MKSLLAATIVLATAGVAEAQISKIPIPGITTGTSFTDFATCEADLPACSETRTDCCYRTFDPGSIIVPMDRCHQALDVVKMGPVNTATSPVYCADPNSSMDGRSSDMGMFKAYGLMFRLMQAGIPVYWMSNPTRYPSKNAKSAEDSYVNKDIDFWVLSPGTAAPPVSASALGTCGAGCTDPVKLLNKTTLVPIADTYNRTAFPLRGAFIIAKQDRTKFDAFWKKQGEYATLTGTNYDFSEVDLYEIQANGTTPAQLAYQNYRIASPTVFNGGGNAPVGQRIDYRAPRLARQGPANVSTHWLDVAGLNVEAPYPSCLDPAYVWPLAAVYCTLTDTDIKTGKLVTGKFDWAWLDSTNSYDAQIGAAISTFATATATRPGGSVVLEGNTADSFKSFITTTGFNSAASAAGEKMIIRYPHNLISGMGDLVPEFASGGGSGKWDYFGGGATGYTPSIGGTAAPAVAGSLVRLITEEGSDSASNPQCTDHRSTATCDVFANNAAADLTDQAVYWRKDNIANNGILFYVGGRNPQSSYGHLRILLNSLIAIPAGTVLQELSVTRQVSRSSPVVATVGTGALSSYQGTTTLITPAPGPLTYAGASSDAVFDFPQTTGHLHRLAMSNLTNNVVTSYSDATAMESFPTATASGCGTGAFKGGCRTVFTNTATGLKPAVVQLSTANRAVLKNLIALASFTTAETDLLISRLLAGKASGSSYVTKLGGIDRSTVAIVEASPNAGASRPTMIYVGALDGMMHAFCGEAKGSACTVAGRELWAYAPRTQLSRLRKNTARIDGSARVVDVMVGGAWKTVLVFQTGAGSPSVAADAPATVALDITDPTAPSILWERTTPTSRTAFEQGVGLGVAIGTVGKDTLAFIATANGGTGSSGIVVQAVDVTTGNTRTGVVDPPTWKFTQAYSAPRLGSVVPVPASAIPAGVTLADVKREGKITRVLVPTLYGDVYVLDAADGTNVLGGTKKLFSFNTDLHPIGAPVSLYRNAADGALYGIAVSGGYSDPVSTVWSPGTTHQYAVSFAVETPATTAPVTDTSNFPAAIRPWVLDLGTGQRAFGQAVIAGAEVFIATDTADANLEDFGISASATGNLRRISLATGSVKTTTTLPGGANGVDVSSDGRVIAGAGNGTKRIDSASFEANGVAVELAIEAVMKRRFWLAD